MKSSEVIECEEFALTALRNFERFANMPGVGMQKAAKAELAAYKKYSLKVPDLFKQAKYDELKERLNRTK